MAWVIAVLGAALAAGGGVALWNGSGYIRLDWGQAQTVAGTVSLSAGVVTIAIAAVLFTLRDLARRPRAAAVPLDFPAAPPGQAGVGLDAVHLADEADARSGPAATPARNRSAGKLARVGRPGPERAEPAVDLDETVADPAFSAARAATAASAMQVEPGTEPRLRGAPVAVPEAPRPAAPLAAEAPTVVGRYEANGASYVLFSDGTIEVETDSGTHRFSSMAALKDHIERQDAE